MSLSVATARERWKETEGRDPLFAAVDGSNCPDAPQSERASHSLLLDRGLIRIAMPWPPAAVKPEFALELFEILRDAMSARSTVLARVTLYPYFAGPALWGTSGSKARPDRA